MNIENLKLTKEHQEATPLIYARQTGPYGYENVLLMERFKSWVSSHNLMTEDAIILGIARDNPQMTPPDQCRYDVCYLTSSKNCPSEVLDLAPDVDWIQPGTTDQGAYMVIQLPHTPEAVATVWQEIFPYLMSQGYQLDFTRPVVERYKKKMVDNHLCEMMVPIKE